VAKGREPGAGQRFTDADLELDRHIPAPGGPRIGNSASAPISAATAPAGPRLACPRWLWRPHRPSPGVGVPGLSAERARPAGVQVERTRTGDPDPYRNPKTARTPPRLRPVRRPCQRARLGVARSGSTTDARSCERSTHGPSPRRVLQLLDQRATSSVVHNGTLGRLGPKKHIPAPLKRSHTRGYLDTLGARKLAPAAASSVRYASAGHRPRSEPLRRRRSALPSVAS